MTSQTKNTNTSSVEFHLLSVPKSSPARTFSMKFLSSSSDRLRQALMSFKILQMMSMHLTANVFSLYSLFLQGLPEYFQFKTNKIMRTNIQAIVTMIDISSKNCANFITWIKYKNVISPCNAIYPNKAQIKTLQPSFLFSIHGRVLAEDNCIWPSRVSLKSSQNKIPYDIKNNMSGTSTMLHHSLPAFPSSAPSSASQSNRPRSKNQIVEKRLSTKILM